MTSASDSQPHTPPVLQIDRVEWLSGTPDAVLVRVLAQRRGPVGDEPPRLLIADGDTQHSFEAEPAEPSSSQDSSGEAENGVWAATFSVPIELRPRLEQGLLMTLGGRQIELPAAVAGAEPGRAEPSASGRVIDREVLAERRARRAELNEQTLMSRTTAAEATIRTLRSQLSNLEQRLEQTAAEREKLTQALSERERDLRAAKQREYAEEQLRFEADDLRRAAELQATAGVAELRQLLHEAERDTTHLQGELEDVRRQLAEAHHSSEADQASVRRLRRELEERQSDLIRREAELRQQEQSAVATLGQSETAQAEMVQRRAELEHRAEELEGQMAEAQRELAAEQARREMLEHELSVRPEPGSDQRADALQVELERRAHLQAQVAGELSLLHGELEQVRASAEHQRERNDEADRLLEDLGRTIGGLRVELEGLERDKHAAEIMAEDLRAEVGELVRALELARTEPRRDDSQLNLLREQVQLRDQQLREAERTINALGQSASELRTELQAERDRHTATAAELRARVEEERQAAARRMAEAEARMREQLTAQGQRLVLQADSSHEASARVTQELDEISERLAASEDALSAAREAERTALEHAATAGRREAELERVVGELSETAAELRLGFEREFAAMQQQLAEQVTAERERYMHELGAMESRVDDLREQLVRAARGLQTELESERSARQQAEQELAGERTQAQQLRQALQRARSQPQAAAAAPAHEVVTGAAATPSADLESRPPSESASEPNSQSAEALAEQRRREMAEALAEAVARLRSRVAVRAEEDEDEDRQSSNITATPGDPTGPVGELAPAGAAQASPLERAVARQPSSAEPTPQPPRDSATDEADSAEPDAQGRTRRPGEPSPADAAPQAGSRSRWRLPRLFGARPGRVIAPARAGRRPGAIAAAPAAGASTPTTEQHSALSLPLTLEAPPEASVLALPDVARVASTPSSWLASALARVATERDAQLAADLIVELLPAQGLHLDQPTTYGLRIGDGGLFVVRGGARRPANVSQAQGETDLAKTEFTLSGSAAALSGLAASGGLRKLVGVEVTGRRRRARRVVRARPAPLSFAELANAGIGVWPGLLLLVLAEGIEASWTEGERFVLAWAIQQTPGALLYVIVSDGAPLMVTHRAPAAPAAAVYLSERAFLSVMAATPLDHGERVLVCGDERPAQRFITWAHRAQGLVPAAPSDRR